MVAVLLLPLAGAGIIWAVPMNGTYRANWVNGESLTSADLNTNFQTIQDTFGIITSMPTCAIAGYVAKWDGLNWGCQAEGGGPWLSDANGLTYNAGNIGLGTASTPTEILSVLGNVGVAGNIASATLTVSGATISAFGDFSGTNGVFTGTVTAFDVNAVNSLISMTAAFNDVVISNNVDVANSIFLASVCHAGLCTSDARLKKEIIHFSNSLDIISSLNPVYFRWRTDEFPEYQFHNRQESGLLAQDVEKVLPHLVQNDQHGHKAVFYNKEIQMHMVQAIKELKAENDELKKRLAALEARLK